MTIMTGTAAREPCMITYRRRKQPRESATRQPPNRTPHTSSFGRAELALMSEIVNYNHIQNRHSVAGAQVALGLLFSQQGRPESLLDVGCGQGTWLRAALDLGIKDVCGLDGVPIH